VPGWVEDFGQFVGVGVGQAQRSERRLIGNEPDRRRDGAERLPVLIEPGLIFGGRAKPDVAIAVAPIGDMKESRERLLL
jgi:hypothetical protein